MMRLNEDEDDPELTGFIHLLFGYESKFTKEEYMERIANENIQWVFDSFTIRKRFSKFLDPELVKKFEDNY